MVNFIETLLAVKSNLNDLLANGEGPPGSILDRED